MSKQAILTELARRVERAKRLKNWRMVETYTATWLRINSQSESELAVAGLSYRLGKGK
jgi:hypothetical protein